MNCNQCGKPIPDNSVFCPFCGVPQKVTADYDYIKDEIGANVDKIKTEGSVLSDEVTSSGKRRPVSEYDMNTTKDVYGGDTVFSDDHRSRSRKEYDDRYDYDDYEEYDDGYDDYDDDYYDDWDIEEGGGNKKTVIATIIIALICLAGIAAIIYFGLKPQEKNNIVDVIKAYNQNGAEINEGDEYSDEVVISLVSEQGYDIRYTIDGSDVDENSLLYTTPITANEEGTFQFKALSFNDKGDPSGDGIAHAVIIVKPVETTTEAIIPEETETVFTKDDAENIIRDALREEGGIDEFGNTGDGGYMNLAHAGETVIGTDTYYIIQADYYDIEGNLFETTYYGVDTQTGAFTLLNRTDDGYELFG